MPAALKSMNKLYIALVIVILTGCNRAPENPLLGIWVIDYERTISSIVKPNDRLRKCFETKLCGKSEFSFSDSELRLTQYDSSGDIWDDTTMKYEIVSVSKDSISLHFKEVEPKSDSNITWGLYESGYFIHSEEFGFSEYYVRKN